MKSLASYSSVFSIGVVALSSPSVGKRKEKIEAAVEYLNREGFKIKLGSSVWSELGYKSASSEIRVDDLNRFIGDAEINLILNTTGGYNTNELLPFVDYNLLKQNPKWIVGYSDITALLLAVYAKTEIATVNGAMLVDYVDNPSCFETLFDDLTTDSRELKNGELTWESPDAKRTMPAVGSLNGKRSAAVGRCVCGNLSTFNLMLGTPYMPDLKGAVFFLEYDKEEASALPSIERFLWQIRLSGAFQSIAGLVFGCPQKKVLEEENQVNSVEEILNMVTAGYDFPVLFNAQFGHSYPSWTLINGDRVEIEGKRIKIVRMPKAKPAL